MIPLSCSSPPPSFPKHDSYPSGVKPPPIAIDSLEKQIHELVNRERRAKGLPVLAWNGRLADAARRHSSDMATRGYFSHQSPEGGDFSRRYRDAGYSCQVPAPNGIYTGGENIFQNSLYSRIITENGRARYDWNSANVISETTVKGWMNSAGHRKNILMPYWKSEGIGIAVSPDGKIYITQNFC